MQEVVCSTGYPLAFTSLLSRNNQYLTLPLHRNKPSITGQTNSITEAHGLYAAAITCRVTRAGS